jgi:hypothetical protein
VKVSSELEPIRSSVIQLKIGNRTYDMVQNPRCGVCMHPARFQIEAKLLLNFGWAAVSRYVSELNSQRIDGTVEEWPALSPAQVRKHSESGHCPVEGEARRALTEQRAKKLGIDLAETTGQFLDHEIVQHAILARGYERLVKGEIEPDVKDTLAAAKLLSEGDKEDANAASEEQWREFMGLYFNAVQKVVSRDQWEEIKAIITSNPVFQSMNATSTNDDEIIDAEEV